MLYNMEGKTEHGTHPSNTLKLTKYSKILG
jgi:hypothetical protein